MAGHAESILIIAPVRCVRKSPHPGYMEEGFKACPHDVLPGKMIVEYWRRGEFVAAIYHHQDGIRIVSKFITGVAEEPGYPRAVIIKLGK